MANVRIERQERVAVLTVDREKKLNALDNDTIRELHAAVDELSADDRVGAVVLTGAGEKAFIAGADISVLAKQGVVEGIANSRLGQALTLAMEDSPKPFLAAINGFALGGGLEMALACDIRFASTNAKLGLPEVGLGIIPGYGGTQRLARLVGSGRALELMLTGDHIPAAKAAALGLVNEVFEPAELLAKVTEVAQRILLRGPTAVAMAKQALRRGAHLSMPDALRLEADLFGIMSSTAEMKEGMGAFLEKRKPNW